MLQTVRAASRVAPGFAAAAGRAMAATHGVDVHTRGFAAESLASLKNRIKATANVAKLTGVMKLVASAKSKAAEDQLIAGRPFGASLMESVTISDEVFKSTFEGEDGSAAGKKQLILTMTTDRGLCGSVNSSLTRIVHPYIVEQQKKGYDVSLFVTGEKGRAQIAKERPDITSRSIDQAFDKEPIFPLAAAVAEKIVNEKFDVLTMVFNRFESAAKFNTEMRHVPQLAGLPVGVLPEKFAGYSVEPDNNEEALCNLMEFAVGGAFYYALLEQQACEISQRVTAMDNASTNAGDMVDRLSLVYNRARQAQVTTELAEIVSGAESIKDEEED